MRPRARKSGGPARAAIDYAPAATYIRHEPCEARHPLDHCLWVELPCQLSPLPQLPRRHGCWMRAPRSCRTEVKSKKAANSVLTQNWTRIRGVDNRLDCLAQKQTELHERCFPGWTLRQRWRRAREFIEAVYVDRLGRSAHSDGVRRLAAARVGTGEAVSSQRRHAESKASSRGVSGVSGGCTATERVMHFQVPRSGTCVSAGAGPPRRGGDGTRYFRNHGHQAEILVPMIDQAVVRLYAPETLHWSWPRTHWVEEVAKAMLPFTVHNRSKQRPSSLCKTTHPTGSHGGGRGWLTEPYAGELMRRAIERHCGLRDRRGGGAEAAAATKAAATTAAAAGAEASRRREHIVVLLRGDSQQSVASSLPMSLPTALAADGEVHPLAGVVPLPSPARDPAAMAMAATPAVTDEPAIGLVLGDGNLTVQLPPRERRQFANLSAVVHALRLALPGASVRTTYTRANASICTQARWVHGASVVLSPHGAHLTNALWMSRGSLLVEAMPWAMWEYQGYQGLFKGIRLARIRSARPPSDQPHWQANTSWLAATLPTMAAPRPLTPMPTAATAPTASAIIKTTAAATLSAAEEQAQCAGIEECRRFYRAFSSLYFGLAEICEALRPHVPATQAPDSACYRQVTES